MKIQDPTRLDIFVQRPSGEERLSFFQFAPNEFVPFIEGSKNRWDNSKISSPIYLSEIKKVYVLNILKAYYKGELIYEFNPAFDGRDHEQINVECW